MEGEFKQCPQGHFYQGESCPYCKTTDHKGNVASTKTEIFVGGCGSETPTETMGGGNSNVGTKTTANDGQETIVVRKPTSSGYSGSRTVFGEDEDTKDPSNCTPTNGVKRPQYGRKLVGWLVTYSLDALGVDFKLYEGRNIIGRDGDCNITVNDGRMSGKHAVLLFRANKYSITDSQSSHGTFVNDEDIELEPHYLQDGDTIRMGSTVFKFRTSL